MKLRDQVTELATKARDTDETMNRAHIDATGLPAMSVEKMTDIYMLMRFEERYEMFLELVSTQGMEGLETAQQIMMRAQERWAR